VLSIAAAAAALGTSPRVLRYREALGLLPAARTDARTHRRYGADALAAATLGARLEQRYDVSPAALAFALRVLADPGVASEVRELGRLTGRLRDRPLDALDFEQEKARRLLRPRVPTPRETSMIDTKPSVAALKRGQSRQGGARLCRGGTQRQPGAA